MKYSAKLGAEYKALWDGMSVTAKVKADADAQAKKMLANKARYRLIERATGVPWHFVALVHYRESTMNFSKNLCNGQPLSMRTTIVPKGRGPYKSFEESAFDALVTIKGYSAKLDWSLGPYIFRIEGYNGYGYHGQGIPSPYLWGGSNKQKRGKYIRDHVFDPNAWDTQLGVLTILRSLMDKDPSIEFGGEKVAPAPVAITPPDVETEDTAPEPSSPKTGETKTVSNSKTLWTTIAGIFTTIFGAVGSVMMDWKALAVFCAFIIIAAFLFIGRERIRKIVDQGL